MNAKSEPLELHVAGMQHSILCRDRKALVEALMIVRGVASVENMQALIESAEEHDFPPMGVLLVPKQEDRQQRIAFTDVSQSVAEVFDAHGANAAARAMLPYNRAARDRALALHNAPKNIAFLNAARAMARRIAEREGTVTSPAVLIALRIEEGWGAFIDAADLRVMGPVFRGAEWERAGWLEGKESPGSHARPVAVWRLRT